MTPATSMLRDAHAELGTLLEQIAVLDRDVVADALGRLSIRLVQASVEHRRTPQQSVRARAELALRTGRMPHVVLPLASGDD